LINNEVYVINHVILLMESFKMAWKLTACSYLSSVG